MAFIYGVDGRLDFLRGAIHNDIIFNNLDYYSKNYGLEKQPEITDYSDSYDYMDDFENWIWNSRNTLESSALIGRVGELDGRQIVAFWNKKLPLISYLLDDCLSALDEKGILEANPIISAPPFGVLDRSGLTKSIDTDDTRVDDPRIQKMRELHLMKGAEKQKIMQDLGLNPKSAEHPMSKSMKDAGLLKPGQKWWAMHSEDTD